MKSLSHDHRNSDKNTDLSRRLREWDRVRDIFKQKDTEEQNVKAQVANNKTITIGWVLKKALSVVATLHSTPPVIVTKTPREHQGEKS